MPAPPEYCPVSMGAEIVAERWNLLIIRELLTGARRFNDIHRGLPGLSRTLLSQRLRTLRGHGLITAAADPTDGYQLTDAGRDLSTVLEALGSWSVRWRFPEPDGAQLNPHLLMWRMRGGLAHDRLPPRRVVIEFTFTDDAGDRPERVWLIADGEDSSVCTRDPLFDIDVFATASSRVWHEIWYGRRSVRESISGGTVRLSGEKHLVAGFVDWFGLSPFAGQVAGRPT